MALLLELPVAREKHHRAWFRGVSEAELHTAKLLARFPKRRGQTFHRGVERWRM